MEAMVKVFIFLFIFISLFTIVAGDDECAHSSCGREEIRVQFPFALEGHQDRSCGYPGFNLSCDKSNGTVLDLGESGKFPVRNIDYLKQELQIYNPDECLPRRFMNFDLTGTPFMAYNYLDLTFYNCSSNFSLRDGKPISCLSTSNYKVYATVAVPGIATRGTYDFGTCKKYATAIVPTEIYYQVWYLIDKSVDLHLRWDAPTCGQCVARGGTCRFKNRTKNEIGCFSHPRPLGLSRTAKYVLGIGIGAPSLLFIALMACYVSSRLKSLDRGNNRSHTELSSSVSPQAPVFIVGLDEAVIQSYPKIVLDESRRLAKPEDNICAICLSAYQNRETLKTIPDCKHSFHAACIDQRLRGNVTCPLCRNVPLQVPMPPPV